MAYMNQDRKAELAPAIKAVMKKYKMQGTISVRHHSTLVVNLKAGALDIIGNANAVRAEKGVDQFGDALPMLKDHIDVNVYWISENYAGIVRDFLTELKAAMNAGNFDKSDIMTDYFHVGWYTEINVGKWNKPYEVK